MSNSSQSIPEPVLPEHKLLAEAAPEIELSASFRSQVLAECSASHAMAQKMFAAKIAAAVFVTLLAVFASYSFWNSEPAVQPQIEQKNPTADHSLSSGGSLSTSASEAELSTDAKTIQLPE